MKIEEYRYYCIEKAGVREGFPFEENTIIFKVMGKIFSLSTIEGFTYINLKCIPKLAIDLREELKLI
jgi:predicted DNA-binding protein (MmcQ/YjbR family)